MNVVGYMFAIHGGRLGAFGNHLNRMARALLKARRAAGATLVVITVFLARP